MASSFVKFQVPMIATSLAFAQCQLVSDRDRTDELLITDYMQ